MKLNLYTNNMERQELFEFTAMLAAKNMALEEEIKRLEQQLDEAVKTVNAYNDHFEDDYDYDDEVPDYDENNYPSMEEEAENVLDKIIKQDYEANCMHEKDVELNQKLNSINARLNGTNSRVVELEKRMAMSDLEYSELKSKILELDRWTVAQANLADRVSTLEEKEDNDGE